MEQWLSGFGQPSAYVVFSRSMAAHASYFGAPAGYGRLAAEVRGSPGWRVVYQKADTVIYQVSLS